MNFTEALQQAIDTAPSPEVAEQLQTILDENSEGGAHTDGTGSSGPGPAHD